LLSWAQDRQVLLTSAVLEFGTSFLWVQEALEKKESY